MDDDLSTDALSSTVNSTYGIKSVKPQATQAPTSPNGFPVVSTDDQNAKDKIRLSMLKDELANETNPANIPIRQREINETQAAIDQRTKFSGIDDDLDSSNLRAAVNQAYSDVKRPDAAPVLGSGLSSDMQSVKQAGNEAIGVGENVLAGGSKLGAMALGGLGAIGTGIATGFDPDAMQNTNKSIQDKLTYKPITAEGQRDQAAIGNTLNTTMQRTLETPGIKQAVEGYNDLSDTVGKYSPAAGTALYTLPRGIATVGLPEFSGEGTMLSRLGSASQDASAFTRIEPTLNGVKPRVKLNVDGSVTPVEGSPVVSQSAPVAPAFNKPTLANASPELQQEIANMQKNGTPLNQAVINRYIEAETLPVPVKITKGEATSDPVQISEEKNGRAGKAPMITPEFMNEQTKALASNFDVIRDKVAPDIGSGHPADFGQQIIDSYKNMDAPIVADINAKYQALRDANGGQFPIDTEAFLSNTNSALKQNLKSNHLPDSIKSDLNDVAENGMDFEKFEALRTNLSNIMRSNPDGNARAAAGIVRDQLESIPLTQEASGLKDIADQARSAARNRFSAMEKDPAYKAAINDGVSIGEPSPLAEGFINKYVTGASVPSANLKQLKSNLANDKGANQTIAAATLDSLKDAAKADPQIGKFMSDSYNKRLNSISNKLPDLVGDEAAYQLSAVGRTAKLKAQQPAGSYINNSNTLVGAMSQGAQAGLRGFLSVKTLGASEAALKGIGILKSNKAAKAATAPGAGITKLSDLGGN